MKKNSKIIKLNITTSRFFKIKFFTKHLKIEVSVIK